MKITTLILTLALSSTGFASNYQVFTTTFLPAVNTSGYTAEIYYLNLPELTLARLGHYQQGDKKKAQQQAMSLLGSAQGKTMLRDLEYAFKGVLRAWEHEITDLPAILVDDSYLIYGVYDLKEAEQLVNSFRAD